MSIPFSPADCVTNNLKPLRAMSGESNCPCCKCHNCGRGIAHNPFGHSSASLRMTGASDSSSDLNSVYSNISSLGSIMEDGKLFCSQECYWSEILDEQNSRKKTQLIALRRTKGFKRGDANELVTTSRKRRAKTSSSVSNSDLSVINSTIQNQHNPWLVTHMGDDKHAMWAYHECSGMFMG